MSLNNAIKMNCENITFVQAIGMPKIAEKRGNGSSLIDSPKSKEEIRRSQKEKSEKGRIVLRCQEHKEKNTALLPNQKAEWERLGREQAQSKYVVLFSTPL